MAVTLEQRVRSTWRMATWEIQFGDSSHLGVTRRGAI